MTLSLLFKVACMVALTAAVSGCNPLTKADQAVDYGTGQEYTEADYKEIAKQIAQDSALALVPGGDMAQFAAEMPAVTKSCLMETFRARRDAAENVAILAHGQEMAVADAEAEYYNTYIGCLAGDKSACAAIPNARRQVITARTAEPEHEGGDHSH
ncbi:MAG: hypothetical protein IE927_03020 [Rhodobacterales bacterium]|nr:hypothetical protein [Rhodobacterales bacterium]